ncbi:MAG: hypothetical protein HDS61_02205 [Barnesiella sp.]|nr:hypothetical protein [Barnesiella sp.]
MTKKRPSKDVSCCGTGEPRAACIPTVEQAQPIQSYSSGASNDSAPKEFTPRYYLEHYAPNLDAFLSSLVTREQQVYGHTDPPELHPHQNVRNVPKAYPEVYQRLKDFAPSRPDLTFEQLLNEINGQIRDIPNIGDLAVYDITLRIGWNLRPRIKPEKLVYMHQGTQKGAELLLDRNVAAKPIPIEELIELVAPISQSHHIEDFLCLYHVHTHNPK